MSKQLHKHCDCRNYAPVDVVKGICHRTKDLILGDERNQCEHYVSAQQMQVLRALHCYQRGGVHGNLQC